METTLTMAGQQAIAGAARLRAGSGVRSASPLAIVPSTPAVSGSYEHLHATKWTVGTVAEPTAFAMVFDGKNRPTRQPSELSP